MTQPREATELEVLLDKQRIHEMQLQYCRGVDRVDAALIAQSFHPDARCEFGELVLTGDAIGPAIAEAAGKCHITTHMLGNSLIEIDGDVAYSELYYLSSAVVSVSGGGHELRMRAGRYIDRVERRDGQWKLADRTVVEDWCRFSDLPELPPGTSFRPGQQGVSDPLYALIAGR